MPESFHIPLADLEENPGGMHSKKFRQGCSCYFLGVEILQIVIFGVAQNEGYFLGVEKISIIF